jgi:hypothetical protein
VIPNALQMAVQVSRIGQRGRRDAMRGESPARHGRALRLTRIGDLTVLNREFDCHSAIVWTGLAMAFWYGFADDLVGSSAPGAVGVARFWSARSLASAPISAVLRCSIPTQAIISQRQTG